MPVCLICSKNIEPLDEKTVFCQKCIDDIKETDDGNVALRNKLAYWDKTKQIYFLEESVWAVSPSGKSFILGKESEILEIIKAQKIPSGLGPMKTEEYERIFDLMNQENKQEEIEHGTGWTRKTSIRAPSTNKRSGKRVRSVSDSRNRVKHFRPTKAPKRSAVPSTGLKK